MPKFQTRHAVNHPASAMFDLVADMGRYPEFVPLCESLVIRSTRQEGGCTRVIADMTVGYKLVRETFASAVVLDPGALAIRAENLDGPFRSMENVWTFGPLDQSSCEIGFSIAYEFRSRALAVLMGSMFDRVFRAYERAFVARADAIYGPGGPAGR